MRTAAIFFFFLLVLGLGLTLRATGSNKDLLPYVGKWTGKFVVEEMTGGGTAQERVRNNLHGYLQLYRTKESYLLHMEGEQEIIDVKGTWQRKGSQIELKATEVKINDFGGEEKRDPNKMFIDPEKVREAYSRPMVLKLSEDKRSLSGPQTSIANLIGRHVFTRL